MKQFDIILSLRRDNDYNYAKIKDTFIPANGEICLVDTARSGLRVVCGDGITPFKDLEFIDNVFVKGYFIEGVFYQDAEKTVKLNANTNMLYIDIPSNGSYYFDGSEYQRFGAGSVVVPNATAETAGIMKLYDTVGQNADGTMTQKAISDELDDKVELIMKPEEELVIFIND